MPIKGYIEVTISPNSSRKMYPFKTESVLCKKFEAKRKNINTSKNDFIIKTRNGSKIERMSKEK